MANFTSPTTGSTFDIHSLQSWLVSLEDDSTPKKVEETSTFPTNDTLLDRYFKVFLQLARDPDAVAAATELFHNKSLSGKPFSSGDNAMKNWTIDLSPLIKRKKSSERMALLLISYCSIILISLFGNLLVCHVVMRTRRLHTVTNTFLANLAISDLLMTILNIPFNLVRFLLNDWPFGVVMCSIVPFVQVSSVYVSTFTMVAIALDRYKVILYPLKPRLTSLQGKIVLVVIWLCSALLSVPYLLYHRVVEDFTYRRRIRCQIDYPSPSLDFRRWLTLATFIAQYVLPLLVTLVAYSCVSRRVWWRVIVGTSTQRQLNVQLQAKKKTIKMLLVVVLFFAICWLPLNAYHLITDFSDFIGPHRHSPTLYLICHWIAMSNVCYNPFIYCWLNDHFRAGAKSWVAFVARKLFCVHLNLDYHSTGEKSIVRFTSRHKDSSTPSSSTAIGGSDVSRRKVNNVVPTNQYIGPSSCSTNLSETPLSLEETDSSKELQTYIGRPNSRKKLKERKPKKRKLLNAKFLEETSLTKLDGAVKCQREVTVRFVILKDNYHSLLFFKILKIKLCLPSYLNYVQKNSSPNIKLKGRSLWIKINSKKIKKLLQSQFIQLLVRPNTRKITRSIRSSSVKLRFKNTAFLLHVWFRLIVSDIKLNICDISNQRCVSNIEDKEHCTLYKTCNLKYFSTNELKLVFIPVASPILFLWQKHFSEKNRHCTFFS